MTNKVIREYEKEALSLGISLTLIDANRIADESEDYLNLQKSILETDDINLTVDRDSVFHENDKNLIFDLIAFGKSSDFKIQIIESHILQCLFKTDKLSLEEIINISTEKFRNKENSVFYEKLMNGLQTSRKVVKTHDRLYYKLTTDENDKINKLKEQFEIDENIFIVGISSILEKYELSSHTEKFINELKKLYIENFSNDINNVIENFTSSDLASLSRDFLLFICNKKGNDFDEKEIAVDLLTFCKQDKFIQKFSASKVLQKKQIYQKLKTILIQKRKCFWIHKLHFMDYVIITILKTNIKIIFIRLLKTL